MNIQRWTLVVVCAATAMLMLDIAVVNTALSRIAEDLDTGLSGLQWVVDAYTLALASVVLTAGALADRLGRRRLFTIGLAIFTLASVACGLAQDIVMLNSARAVQGIGAAIMFAVSLALLAHAFPGARERAGALAAYGAAIGASFAIGPLVGGLLTSGLDWQWIFLINVPIGLFCVWITRTHVEESRDPNAHGIDWPGQVTLTAGLFLLVLALLRGNEDGWTSTVILAELTGAAVALVSFVLIEMRVREPMLPMRLFRDATFTGAQIAAFAISASFFAIFLYATLYLQQILGLSAIEAGLVYLPGTMLLLIVSAATAQLGAKVPARTMIAGGLALVAAGMALFTLADETSSWWAVMPGLLLACLGTGLFNPALSNVALGAVPVEQSGLAAGVNDTARQAGIAVGVAALGALIPAEAALNGGGAAEYVAGLHDAFLVGRRAGRRRRCGRRAADRQALRHRGDASRRPRSGPRSRRARSPRQPRSRHLARDHLRDRERGRGGRRRRIEHVHRAPGAGEQEVVEQGPVASERLRADAGRARPHVLRAERGHVAGGRADEQAAARGVPELGQPGPPPLADQPCGAGPAQRRAEVVPPHRGQPVRVARRRQERGRADQHLAVDRARQVDAEERQRRVGHRIDLAAHEIGALRRQP